MKIFTVSQINRMIKDLIDNEVILEDITVTGELSSFSVNRNIMYFTLKDNDNLLYCIKYKATQEFKVGDLVQCRGNIKYYPKGGKLTFSVNQIEHCGQGELYKQFLMLKEKLSAEGLFDERHKIPIPRFITSIGVVTSQTGAVLQDIINVSHRRNPNLDIYVYDAQVQGSVAVRQVIEGITYFDNYSDVDVIIVARGGGSLEDLSAFNDEELARIAYICNKPLISAVGHETDYSILDFVADLRAPTPSAAAELVTYVNKDLIQYIDTIKVKLDQYIRDQIEKIQSSILASSTNIDYNINELINDEVLLIKDCVQTIDEILAKNIDNTIHRVDIALNTLDKLNPITLLKKGYSLVSAKNQPVNYKNVNVGDEINIRTADMKMTAEIINKEKL